jgi:hypothetical protein
MKEAAEDYEPIDAYTSNMIVRPVIYSQIDEVTQ